MGNDVYPWVAENRLATMFFSMSPVIIKEVQPVLLNK